MAYELLCQTLGKDKFIPKYEVDSVYGKVSLLDKIGARIDIYEVAESLGINVTTKYDNHKHNIMNGDDFVDYAQSKLANQNFSNIPYTELYRKRELVCCSEVATRKSFFSEDDYVAQIYLFKDIDEANKRYYIALGIAKIYFAKNEEWESILEKSNFEWNINVLETPQQLIERIFAYALLAPDKNMLICYQDYKDSNWTNGRLEYFESFSNYTGLPYAHTIYMMQIWKNLQSYKYNKLISNEKINIIDIEKAYEEMSIPKARLLQILALDPFGIEFLRKNKLCKQSDYARILGGYVDGKTANISYDIEREYIDTNYSCYYVGDYPYKSVPARMIQPKSGEYHRIDGIYSIFSECDLDNREIGIRLAFDWDKIEELCFNIKEEPNGTIKANYGIFPSTAVSKEYQNKLEELYNNNELVPINLTYTVDKNNIDSYNDAFIPETIQVYEYQGKYILRVRTNIGKGRKNVCVSNREEYNNGEYVWIELKPLQLIVDVEGNTAITENVISAGVRYKDLAVYFDTYLSNELYQSAILLQEKKMLSQEQSGPVKKLTLSNNRESN